MYHGAELPTSEVLSGRENVFKFSQRVLQIKHSFKVQNSSTGLGDLIFWNFFGARAARQNILGIHSKMAKKRIFTQFLARANFFFKNEIS